MSVAFNTSTLKVAEHKIVFQDSTDNERRWVRINRHRYNNVYQLFQENSKLVCPAAMMTLIKIIDFLVHEDKFHVITDLNAFKMIHQDGVYNLNELTLPKMTATELVFYVSDEDIPLRVRFMLPKNGQKPSYIQEPLQLK